MRVVCVVSMTCAMCVIYFICVVCVVCFMCVMYVMCLLFIMCVVSLERFVCESLHEEHPFTHSFSHTTHSLPLSHTHNNTHILFFSPEPVVSLEHPFTYALSHTQHNTHTRSSMDSKLQTHSLPHTTQHNTLSLAHAQQTTHALSLSLEPTATRTHIRTHAHTNPVNMS